METIARVSDTYEYEVCQNCLCAWYNGTDSVESLGDTATHWIQNHRDGYSLDDSILSGEDENGGYGACDVCDQLTLVFDCTLTEWA